MFKCVLGDAATGWIGSDEPISSGLHNDSSHNKCWMVDNRMMLSADSAIRSVFAQQEIFPNAIK